MDAPNTFVQPDVRVAAPYAAALDFTLIALVLPPSQGGNRFVYRRD